MLMRITRSEAAVRERNARSASSSRPAFTISRCCSPKWRTGDQGATSLKKSRPLIHCQPSPPATGGSHAYSRTLPSQSSRRVPEGSSCCGESDCSSTGKNPLLPLHGTHIPCEIRAPGAPRRISFPHQAQRTPTRFTQPFGIVAPGGRSTAAIMDKDEFDGGNPSLLPIYPGPGPGEERIDGSQRVRIFSMGML